MPVGGRYQRAISGWGTAAEHNSKHKHVVCLNANDFAPFLPVITQWHVSKKVLQLLRECEFNSEQRLLFAQSNWLRSTQQFFCLWYATKLIEPLQRPQKDKDVYRVGHSTFDKVL